MTFTGYIYKITGTCGRVYIGSTINFEKRKLYHKMSSKSNESSSRFLTKPLHFEIMNSREYKLVKTLRLVEQFYLDNTININKTRAYSNLFIQRKQKKQYHIKNREEILQKKKVRYDKNKEKLLKKNKEYRLKNIEKLKKKRKEYYNKNKEKINLKSKVKIKCECGCMVIKSYLPKHKTTSKHINLLNKIKSL